MQCVFRRGLLCSSSHLLPDVTSRDLTSYIAEEAEAQEGDKATKSTATSLRPHSVFADSKSSLPTTSEVPAGAQDSKRGEYVCLWGRENENLSRKVTVLALGN